MNQANATLKDVAGCNDAKTRLRPPQATDGAQVWALIEATPTLDSNSLYANLLQCTHFSATSVVAEREGGLVGWMSGYVPPDQPDMLFVWQVVVSNAARGQGLGKQLVGNVLMRPSNKHIRRVACTITDANKASWALFGSIAGTLNAPLRRDEHFTRDAHFAGQHDSEFAVTIGPFGSDRVVSLAADYPRS